MYNEVQLYSCMLDLIPEREDATSWTRALMMATRWGLKLPNTCKCIYICFRGGYEESRGLEPPGISWSQLWRLPWMTQPWLLGTSQSYFLNPLIFISRTLKSLPWFRNRNILSICYYMRVSTTDLTEDIDGVEVEGHGTREATSNRGDKSAD